MSEELSKLAQDRQRILPLSLKIHLGIESRLRLLASLLIFGYTSAHRRI